MIGFLRDLFRVLPGVLGALFIGTTTTIFLLFPRIATELANLLNIGDPPDPARTAVQGVIALLINVALFYFFIWRPLRHLSRMRRDRGLLVRRGQGVAFMDTESVRQQVYTAVTRVPEVQRAEISVMQDMGRATVLLNILASPSINAGKKKAEIRREVKKVVEDQLGISLAGEPQINIRLESLGLSIPEATAAAASAANAHPTTPAYTPTPAPSRPPADSPAASPIRQTRSFVPPRPIDPEPEPEPEPILAPRNPELPHEPPHRAEPGVGAEPELLKGIHDIHTTASPGSGPSPVFTRRTFVPAPMPRPETRAEPPLMTLPPAPVTPDRSPETTPGPLTEQGEADMTTEIGIPLRPMPDEATEILPVLPRTPADTPAEPDGDRQTDRNDDRTDK